MIIIHVELHSARTGEVTELARMKIVNDETGTPTRGNYDGAAYFGRNRRRLNLETVSRTGRVENYGRGSTHVWNLIARMLASMGYQ